MDPATIIRDCATASAEARIGFAEVVGRLAAIGVERYFVDLVQGDSVYYLPGDDTERLAGHAMPGRAAAEFDAAAMAAAVRAAQAGLPYPAFRDRALEAGCVGYLACIAGRRVVYFGRSGDCHVEHFP